MRAAPSLKAGLKPVLRVATGGLALILLAACGKPESPAPAAVSANANAGSPGLQAIYERSCKACHAVAGTGAPLSGDAAAWAPRVAQGIETLLDHTFNGYNAMPPMGACMDCTEEQFELLIEMMSGTSFD